MTRDNGVSWSLPVQSRTSHKPALHHVTPQKVYPAQPAAAAAPLATAVGSKSLVAPKQDAENNKKELFLGHQPEKPRHQPVIADPVPASAPPPQPEGMTPKREVKPPPKPLFEPRKSGRPSLSDQLAGLSAKSESITKGIKQSLVKGGEDTGKEAAKLLCQCDRFVVGRARGTFTSPVQFFGDRLLYAFIHPAQDRIEMRMMFAHMSDLELDDASMTFAFRIRKPIGTTFYRKRLRSRESMRAGMRMMVSVRLCRLLHSRELIPCCLS